MAVYALYIPTARRPVSGIEMEKFPSQEQAALILKQRNNTKRSDTYYVAEREDRAADAVRGFWQSADRTGYMRVFLRSAADPAPGLLDTPDEEWILEKDGKTGVVIRLPWLAGDEEVKVRGDRLSVAPARTAPRPADPAYEVRQAALVKPVGVPCEACYQVPAVTGRCGCS